MQNNCKEMCKKVCCKCKVAFLLIRPIVVFLRSPALPSPLSIARFYILFEQTINIIESHPDFEIRGGGLQKQIFRPFGPHFALSIRGGGEEGGPPGPLPWIRRRYKPSSFCVFINVDFISLHKNTRTNMTYMQQS